MDAGTAGMMVIVAGLIGIGIIELLMKHDGAKIFTVLLIGFFMSVIAGKLFMEDNVGNLADLEIGTGYTYRVDDWLTSSFLSGSAVARITDQDDEVAFYRVPCLNIRGGCESVPQDGTPFQIIDGGKNWVIVPIESPSNR